MPLVNGKPFFGQGRKPVPAGTPSLTPQQIQQTGFTPTQSKRATSDPRFAGGQEQVTNRNAFPHVFSPPPPTPAPTRKLLPGGAQPIQTQIDPGAFQDNPLQELIRTGAFTAQEIQGQTLPQFLNLLNADFFLPQVGEFVGPSQTEVPGTVSLVDTLKRLSPGRGADVTESQFKPTEFQGSEFIGAGGQPEFQRTQAITPDVLNDPAFKSFQADLEKALGKSSQQLVEEQSRRGILQSGATEEAFGRLGESAQRATAAELGRLASPLISQSILQQAIGEPIRETAFGERGFGRRAGEAGRETGFGERQAGRETEFDFAQELQRGGGIERAIQRTLGLAGGEQQIQQRSEDVFAGLERSERDRVQDFINRQANIGFEQEVAGQGFLGNIQNLINAAVTGGQTGGGGNLGALVSQQGQERQAEEARRLREQQASQFRQGQTTSGISSFINLADLLSRNQQGNISLFN